MKFLHLRNTSSVLVVALALSAVASHAAIISSGDILHAPDNTSLDVGKTIVGSLTVNGGTVLDAANASFGATVRVSLGTDAGSNGTGIVTGAGSIWNVGNVPNTATFFVGGAGTGTLTANQGGTISVLGALNVAAAVTGNGTVNIDGAGSKAQMQLFTIVGSGSTGVLNVTGGGLLTTTQLLAGQFAGSNGTVTINGAGSTIQTTGLSLVGPNGTGSLQITNGGKFISSFSASNQSALTLGSNSGGNGTVTVSGIGSKIEGRGIITVGLNPGPNTVGTLNITGGGAVEEAALQGAFSAGATGNITVSGSGSLLHLSSFSNQQTFMNIGRLGTAQLDVTAGGKVLMDPTAANVSLAASNLFNIGGGTTVAGAGNSNGTVNVSGMGSEIRQKGDFSFFNVGRNGTGVLNITNGGQVISEHLTGASFSSIGRVAGANGTVLVNGAGSLWQAGNKLFIGTNLTPTATGGTEAPGGGTGTLTVANGGKVIVGSDVIVGTGGTLKGGGGTIEGNIVNKGNIAPGNSPGIMTVIGNLTLTTTGNLNLELGGISNANLASPLYDQIKVVDNAGTVAQEGHVLVDGGVNVTFFSGFNPHAGDFFDILTGLDITQLNPLYHLPTLDTGLSWSISELTTDGGEILRLAVVGQVAAVSEPNMFMLLGIGLLGFGTLRRQRR